ncbi:MAG TPA: SDR family oxidoreductase [Candidatus Dormibacteraeota bacterium]|nr:SDR family oxidoreductase [Candidatus Dormibacteraeota bacterium]
MNQLSGKTALVVGASRGLGRGVAEAFIEEGASVVAVARDPSPLADLAARSTQLQIEAADASDPIVAGTLLERHAPDVLALVAGATPLLRPVHHHTWETFSANWHTDVRMTFNWLREALLLPMRRGSRVIVMSSGAALQGSPLSGGYAGAKATQRFMAEYAAQESRRSGLGITVTAVLPRLTPATDLGRPAVAAYAARSGLSEADYLAQLGEPVTPRVAGAAFLRLAAGSPDGDAAAYLLTGEGLQPLK